MGGRAGASSTLEEALPSRHVDGPTHPPTDPPTCMLAAGLTCASSALMSATRLSSSTSCSSSTAGGLSSSHKHSLPHHPNPQHNTPTRHRPPTCAMTKCSRLVLRSVPLTSANFSRVSSLNPAAAPFRVPCGGWVGGWQSAGGRGEAERMAAWGAAQERRGAPTHRTCIAHVLLRNRGRWPFETLSLPAPSAAPHLVQVVAQLQHRLQHPRKGGTALQLAAGRAHQLQVLHALQIRWGQTAAGGD